MGGSVLSRLSPAPPQLMSLLLSKLPTAQPLCSVVSATVAGLAHWSISGHVATPEPITVVGGRHSADWPPLELGARSPYFSSWLKLGEAGSPKENGHVEGRRPPQEMIN